VLLDLHQDGWGPATHGDGMPAWATITDGLPNPPDPFPTYYLTNPALQRALDSFWTNRRGPDGVRLQTHYVRATRVLARRFAGASMVIGQDPMNEPWPGTEWEPCLAGSPAIERTRLVPFYRRFAAAVRPARHALVFIEPFVLYTFGMSQTVLPAIGGGRAAFSFHVYAGSPDADRAVMRKAVAHGEATGAALLATEWGATDSVTTIQRTAGQFDAELVPWIFWSHEENVVHDPADPPEGANLHPGVIEALTRPYPVATNGTPLKLTFDPTTSTLDYTYATRRSDGSRARKNISTLIEAPASTYPTGYVVRLEGGAVTSARNAPTLTIRAATTSTEVHVHVAPAT
jgi:endoglycosylceramidase